MKYALKEPLIPGISFHARMTERCLPEMGCSIGVVGEEGKGSLGGFVLLKLNGKTHKGFLTKHHVVRPPASASAMTRKQAERYGYSYFSQPSQLKPRIQYLAVKEVRETRKTLEELIREESANLENWRKEVQDRAKAQLEPRPALERLVKNSQALVHPRQKMLDKVKSMPESIGDVLISSGKSVNGTHILDWAFVELSGPEQSQLFRPNIIPSIPINQQPLAYGITSEVHNSQISVIKIRKRSYF